MSGQKWVGRSGFYFISSFFQPICQISAVINFVSVKEKKERKMELVISSANFVLFYF